VLGVGSLIERLRTEVTASIAHRFLRTLADEPQSAAASRAAREVVAATAPPDIPPAEQVTTIAIAGFSPQRELRTGHPAGHGVARTPRRCARPGARVARCA
jgi:hypothetical protein